MVRREGPVRKVRSAATRPTAEAQRESRDHHRRSDGGGGADPERKGATSEIAVSEPAIRRPSYDDLGARHASRSGSPSRGNWSAWNVVISVIAPPVMRRTSIVSGTYAPSPSCHW